MSTHNEVPAMRGKGQPADPKHKLAAFKAELRALLIRYNADLGVNIEGDTHGMMTRFEVEIDCKDHTLNEHSAYLQASDLL